MSIEWERPSEYDLTHCGGCGKHDSECDGECPEHQELVRKALEDEAKGIYLPSYCACTNKRFCTKCGRTVEGEEALCSSCL